MISVDGAVEESPVDVVSSGSVPAVVVISSVVLASDSVGVTALLWIKGVGSTLVSPG